LISDIDSSEKHIMYFNNDNSHALAEALPFDLLSEKQVASSLLSNENFDSVKICFDITSKQVKQVSKI